MSLELKGTARLNELDVDKTGAGHDEQELKVTYKVGMVCGASILAYFDPALRSFLFNPETLEPRFQSMKPIAWKGSSRNMDLELGGVKLSPVLVSGYSFEAMSGEKLALRFIVTAHPTEQQLAESSRLLKTEIEISLTSGGQLGLDIDGGGPHSVTAPGDPKPNVAPMKQALKNAEIKLNGWPEPEPDGTFKPSEQLNYKDERLHLDCAASINLVQTGESTWLSATRLVLPDAGQIDGAHGVIYAEGEPTLPTRALAIAREVAVIMALTASWSKANKRAAAAKRQAVAAVEKWASQQLLGGASASVKEEAPKKPTMKKITTRKELK